MPRAPVPTRADVRDDMVLEAAVNGQCQFIVTWNVRDFAAAASTLGIAVVDPPTFLNSPLEETP